MCPLTGPPPIQGEEAGHGHARSSLGLRLQPRIEVSRPVMKAAPPRVKDSTRRAGNFRQTFDACCRANQRLPSCHPRDSDPAFRGTPPRRSVRPARAWQNERRAGNRCGFAIGSTFPSTGGSRLQSGVGMVWGCDCACYGPFPSARSVLTRRVQRMAPRSSAAAFRRRSVSPMFVSRSALRSLTPISSRSARRKYQGMSRSISKDSVTFVSSGVDSNR